jgi:Tfp pilus assembly protein PilV
MKPALKKIGTASGFTLVEMLMSVVVLVMLVIFVAAMMGSATTVTTIGGKRTDSDGQARLVFDRMASDFAGMTRRTDADYIFAKQNGNDTMYFYSEAPAFFQSSLDDSVKNRAALVGYRVNSSYQLERLSQGLTWDGKFSSLISPGSLIFLTYASGSSTPIASSTIAGNWGSPPGSPTNYHVIGDQVYRLEVSFLQTNGTIKSSVTSYNGLQGVSAIVVALGMLDTASRAMLPSGIPAGMVNALPDSVDDTPTLQTWKASTYLTASGIPQATAAQLRIYERTFYLNTQ